MNLMTQVIKGEQAIKEHQLGVGQMQVIFCALSDLFQLSDHIVRKVPHRSSRKRRQARIGCRAVFLQKPLDQLEDIFLNDFAPPPTLDFHLSLRAPDAHVGPGSQEGEAPDLLAPLNRFKKKRIRLLLRNREKGRDGGQQVGADRLHDRDQRRLARQPRELFEIWLQHVGFSL